MIRLSKQMEKLEKKIENTYQKHKTKLPKLVGLALIILYFYGMIVRFITGGIQNTFEDTDQPLFTLNPFSNILAAISPKGIGLALLIAFLVFVFSRRGRHILSGYKSVFDRERNIEILPEGTHGTSGWMDRAALHQRLEVGNIRQIASPIMGKLSENGTDNYVGIPETQGMSRNIMVYGSPGTGKSRGFVMPFIMQAVKRGESLVICDPKAEFYEMYSEYLRNEGYFVRSYNLLDLEASDGWNCLMDSAKDINLVQHIAEIIIRNTSADSEREDFWSKAEKNLLMALIHLVQTRTYPQSDQLLPEEERSLGAIYQLIASTNVNELDAQFRALPAGHPALPPYGIFRQAPHNIWGNILIGLGSRLNVFQNKLVDAITKHNEINLELPGKQKCAYFCIISDQDDTLRFLSSMFFSLLFIKLFDFARQSESRRLPVRVNVLMDEFCNLDLPNSKKWLSVSRSRNCDIQCVAQSVSQLADRYPKTEWQELVGDCDYQLFLGCNDGMTADFISSQCGTMTVRTEDTNTPVPPFLYPMAPRPYMHRKSTTSRPLLMPDEVRRLPKNQAILLIRGEKPIKLYKVSPEEHPDYGKLHFVKATDHIPEWRLKEQKPCPTVGQGRKQMSFYDKQNERAEYIPTGEKAERNPVPIEQMKGTNLKEVNPKDV